MRRAHNFFCLGALIALVGGCSERQQVANSPYSVVRPESWNPDGHPGIFLYYKGKSLWFNVYCPDYGYQDGILVFEGDLPDSLFNGQAPGNESRDSSRSFQIFAIRGAGPPVIISERIARIPLRDFEFTVREFSAVPNGFEVTFESLGTEKKSSKKAVSWVEIKAWLEEAERKTPIKKSLMGEYRYLPLQTP